MSENSLVEIRPTSALEVFTTPEKIEAVLARVDKLARQQIATDVSTAKGRKEIASLAYKVAQTKTYIDTVGKELVADMKELPKKIDESRRIFRDRLDALRDELRAPLDAWEAEQERIAKEKAEAEAAAKARADRIEHDIRTFMQAPQIAFGGPSSVIEAHLKNIERIKPEPEGFDDRFAEALRIWTASFDSLTLMLAQCKERERFEQDQRDRRIAAEAEERARKAAEQQVIDARLAQERAERERAEAEQRAAQAATQAAQRERERIEAEQRQQAAEAQRRAADVENRKAKNNAALADLVQVCGLSNEVAKTVIVAIASGKVANIQILY